VVICYIRSPPAAKKGVTIGVGSFSKVSFRQKATYYRAHYLMMMIAFITVNSNLGPIGDVLVGCVI